VKESEGGTVDEQKQNSKLSLKLLGWGGGRGCGEVNRVEKEDEVVIVMIEGKRKRWSMKKGKSELRKKASSLYHPISHSLTTHSLAHPLTHFTSPHLMLTLPYIFKPSHEPVSFPPFVQQK